MKVTITLTQGEARALRVLAREGWESVCSRIERDLLPGPQGRCAQMALQKLARAEPGPIHYALTDPDITLIANAFGFVEAGPWPWDGRSLTRERMAAVRKKLNI